MERALFEV